jgi:glycosyltransferase involved in cell wall biosynthesis
MRPPDDPMPVSREAFGGCGEYDQFVASRLDVRPEREKRLKIAFAVPSLTSYDAFLRDLAEELERSSVKVCVLAGSALQGSFDIGPHIERRHWSVPRGLSPVGALKAAFHLRRLIREIQPDLLHAHFFSAAFPAALGLPRSRPPLLVTFQGLHSTVSSGRSVPFHASLESLVFRRAHHTWLVNKFDLDRLGRAGDSVSVQPGFGFGCRLDRFSPDRFGPEARLAWRRRFGIGQADPVLIFVGRQTAFKGYDVAVRAFFRLLGSIPEAKLLLVGSRDPIHTSGLSPHEEQKVEASPSIIKAGWTEQVAEHFSISDLNIFPSRREGMPVNLMESLAMGVPVVTCDARGCRDVVRTGVDGLVLPERSEQAFAGACQLLLTDRRRLADMAKAAIKGRHRFSRMRYVREQILAYSRVVPQFATVFQRGGPRSILTCKEQL